MGLSEYHRKRDFTRTKEPRGKPVASKKPSYVIQKHAASRLHYDFRLEHKGVLLSWAVPKGPSLDPADKRLAVQVEDHPVQYGSFEGVIPQGEYGGGSVLLWDRGTWTPEGDVDAALRKGHLDFVLHGKKLRGAWRLVRLRDRTGGEDKNWLLMKRNDDEARPGEQSIVDELPQSVASGKLITQIDSKGAKQWSSNKGATKTAAKPSKPAAPKPRAAKQTTKQTKQKPARTRTTKSKKVSVDLAGARRAPLPGFVPVQLATLVDTAPEGDGWVHEVKYDGYRMLVQLDRGKVRWFSRNNLDWTERFDALSQPIADLPAQQALLDGEVVVLDEGGVSHFQGLQQALGENAVDRMTYFAFDLLHLDGYDLRGCKLIDRKNALRELLGEADTSGALRYSEHVESRGAPFLHAACAHALEGIVSKRVDGLYVPSRSREWMKIKCGHRQEFVVAGFTEPKGAREGLGALVLAVRDGKHWRYAGRVGTGLDSKLLPQLRATLDKLRRSTPPFDEPVSADNRRGVTWVEPRVVVEVSFAAWTADGNLRHASFEGLRPDKDARSVVRERALPVSRSQARTLVRPSAAKKVGTSSARTTSKRTTKKSAAKPTAVAKRTSAKQSQADDGTETVAGVRITHPERVLDKESGITKLEVARYYERVAPLLLPHIESRPLSVVRCPSGFAGACFFQKHNDGTFAAAVDSIALRDSSGKARYLSVDTLEGLISLVQMNVVELHPWGSRRGDLERPDRMFFDLDPDPRVPWELVVEGAFLLRDVLARMEIDSFAKTTGGKGLHVVVPLTGKSSWDEIKAFSRAIAFELARVQPKRYVAIASKTARHGRIFIDYLRNGRGATAVAPYSLRSRAGAPLSMPISWKELESTRSGDAFRLEHGAAWKPRAGRDPWAKFLSSGQVLPKGALKAAVQVAGKA